MNDIFDKFLNKYFFKWKKYTFKESTLTFKGKQTLKRISITYTLSFLVYFFAIWFVIDISITWLTTSLFFFSLIPLAFSIAYAVAFLWRNNKVPKWRACIYGFIILVVFPGYYLYSWILEFPEWIAYYFFYMFFVFIYFTILPWLTNILENFSTNIRLLLGIILFICKWLFVKLDKHNIVKIVNRMGVSKVSHKKVVKYIDELKNKFRFYGGILAWYTFINLITGISIYGVYIDHIKPFTSNATEYIELFSSGSKWLLLLSNLSYTIVFIWITLAFAFLVINTLFMYLEIFFFEILEERLEKLEKKKNK